MDRFGMPKHNRAMTLFNTLSTTTRNAMFRGCGDFTHFCEIMLTRKQVSVFSKMSNYCKSSEQAERACRKLALPMPAPPASSHMQKKNQAKKEEHAYQKCHWILLLKLSSYDQVLPGPRSTNAPEYCWLWLATTPERVELSLPRIHVGLDFREVAFSSYLSS